MKNILILFTLVLCGCARWRTEYTIQDIWLRSDEKAEQAMSNGVTLKWEEVKRIAENNGMTVYKEFEPLSEYRLPQREWIRHFNPGIDWTVIDQNLFDDGITVIREKYNCVWYTDSYYAASIKACPSNAVFRVLCSMWDDHPIGLYRGKKENGDWELHKSIVVFTADGGVKYVDRLNEIQMPVKQAIKQGLIRDVRIINF